MHGQVDIYRQLLRSGDPPCIRHWLGGSISKLNLVCLILYTERGGWWLRPRSLTVVFVVLKDTSLPVCWFLNIVVTYALRSRLCINSWVSHVSQIWQLKRRSWLWKLWCSRLLACTTASCIITIGSSIYQSPYLMYTRANRNYSTMVSTTNSSTQNV